MRLRPSPSSFARRRTKRATKTRSSSRWTRALAALQARVHALLHPSSDIANEPGAGETTVKVILGLGNPGREYEHTRHNVGWMVLDHLADVWHFSAWRKDGEALTASGTVNGAATRLVKPLTYMNLSGQVLKPWLRRPFWAAAKDLLVVVDEVALPLGSIRLRANGSAGGHNGLKSIEHHLKSRDYPRLRIGIKPLEEQRTIGDLSDFVLGPFGKSEKQMIDELMPTIRAAIEAFIAEGATAAMNKYNGVPGTKGQ